MHSPVEYVHVFEHNINTEIKHACMHISENVMYKIIYSANQNWDYLLPFIDNTFTQQGSTLQNFFFLIVGY